MKSVRFLIIAALLLCPLLVFAGSGESNAPPPPSVSQGQEGGGGGGAVPNVFSKKPRPVGEAPTDKFEWEKIDTLNILNPSKDDQSIVFLRKIFGNIQGNILGGGLDLSPTQGQILGRMMEVLNYGIMIVAGVLVSYIVITGVMNTAHEGEFMGRNFKSGWVIMRVIFGSILLLPNQATGYSLAQWLVMWMAVQGIGLADNVWSRGLDYFKAGGSMYTVPDTLSQEQFNEVSRVFMSQICMYRTAQEEAKKAAAAQQGQSGGNLNPGGGSPRLSSSPDFARVKAAVVFPGVKDKSIESSCGVYSWAMDPLETINLAHRVSQGPPQAGRGVSGIGLQTDTGLEASIRQAMTEDPKVKEFTSLYEGYKEAGLRAIIKNLEPAAKAIVAADGKSSTGLKQQVTDAFINALISYAQVTEPARAYTGDVGRYLFDKYYQQMRDEGWIFAGRYYHVLGWIKQQTDSVNNFFFKTSTYPPVLTDGFGRSTTVLQDRELPLEVSKDLNLYLQYYPDIANLIVQKNAAPLIPDVPSNLQASDESVQRIIFAILTFGLSEVQQAWSASMKSGGEPITKLQVFGKETLNIITASWIGVALIAASSMFAAGWISAISPGSYVVLAVLSILVPLYVTVSLALFISALVFGFYLPLIPYILFTFAAFGWGIMLVMGILVAPLMALLLIYPEGHDWVGRAEQGVLLLVSIFIRPTLLVLGLIIAMLFSKVAIDLINAGFDTIITDLGLTSGFTGPLAVIAFMIIYTSILFIIIQQVFTTCIVKLPEQVERLLGFQGAGAGVEMAASAAQQSEQGFTQAAQQIGQAGSGAVTSAAQAGEKYGTAGGEHAKEDAKEAKKKGVSVEGIAGGGSGGGTSGDGGQGGGTPGKQ